jgi:hypothetical protein
MGYSTMRSTTSSLAFASLLVSQLAVGQNITNTIQVNTPLDIGGNPFACSLREALANVNAGGKVGNNSCAAAAKTMADETTLIALSNFTFALDKPLEHVANHAMLNGGILDGKGSTTMFVARNVGTHTFFDGMILRNSGMSDVPGNFGSAVWVQPGASFTGRRSAFMNNRGQQGGAMLFGGEKLDLWNTAMTDNRAKLVGGALFIRQGAKVKMDLMRLSRNTAEEQRGGAIWAEGPFSLSNSRVESNRADEGGAIVMWAPSQFNRVNFEANISVTGEDG